MASNPTQESAAARERFVLDSAHVGDIRGAFGTIGQHEEGRHGLRSRMLALLAIIGPGLIVMVGDNDAGGVATYSQAGQNYGTSLLWVLLLLVPVLIVNQEMVVRLGAVTGVGHARLINERFGRFWGWFSVGDLFVLNFLTIVTEFIGVSLSLGYLGVSEYVAVPIAAVALVAITVSGSFRAWERAMFAFVFANLLIIPLFFMAHPHGSTVARDFFVPGIQGGASSTSVLLIIAMVGTTVAPWQLFFQQSNVIDKRITPRWINYERIDTLIGAAVVVIGAGALLCVSAFAFAGTPYFGHFTDAGGTAEALDHTLGSTAGAFFAVILLNASLIGAGALTLSTSYAFGDVFGMQVLAAPQLQRREDVLRDLRRHDRRGGRDRADPRRPAGRDHGGRAGAGGDAAALRERLPAAALQRPGSARTLAQPAVAQRGRERGRVGARSAVADPDDHDRLPRRGRHQGGADRRRRAGDGTVGLRAGQPAPRAAERPRQASATPETDEVPREQWTMPPLALLAQTRVVDGPQGRDARAAGLPDRVRDRS